jgi:hypothetical protein
VIFDDVIAMGGIDDMDLFFSDASVAQDKENMRGISVSRRLYRLWRTQ